MKPRKTPRAALYARYSTEKQSEASVDDQFRICERLAERERFDVVARFEDRGISGGTTNRPGYQALLSAARAREIDVIVAEDTSRLWRELSEQWRALKELADLHVHVVGHGIDTRREESKILLAVSGAMAEAFRDEIARRTRRGLEGRAAAGKSTGGRAFGFIPASASATGRVEINETEAAIVVKIFEWYADGSSPRSIAARLNAANVPSPGASWQRKSAGPNSKRRRKWVASAIHGDPRRGTGILNNERYRGMQTWGRSKWERSAADSSRRVASVVEDRTQWVTYEEPRLRVVPEDIWARVKARQSAMAVVRAQSGAAATGRPATTLLSGLLICESCGSRFIAVDAYCYGCSSHKNGGLAACVNGARVNRKRTEKLILSEIEAEVLSDEAVSHAQRTMHDELRRAQRRDETTRPHRPTVAKLDAQEQQVRALMRAGTLSPNVAQAALDILERERAEHSRGTARRELKASADVIRLIPQTAELYREAVRNLNSTLTEPEERAQARALIAEMLGGEVKVRQEGEAVYARLETDAGVLVASAGSSNEINYFQRGSGGRI